VTDKPGADCPGPDRRLFRATPGYYRGRWCRLAGAFRRWARLWTLAVPRCRLVVVGLAVLLLAGPGVRAEEPPLAAAASNLNFALEALLEAHERAGGASVRVVYGASGNLARQIRQGAPFSLFLSADERFVLELAEAGHLEDEGAVYAHGRLALFVPEGAPVAVADGLAGLGEAASTGRLRRLAIANPEHAPYGRAARQALEAAGLWAALEPRLAVGESVAQALRFATSGAAEAAIVAASLLSAPEVASAGAHAAIAESLHGPLRQRMALTPEAGDAARGLHDFILSEPGAAILADHGYIIP